MVLKNYLKHAIEKINGFIDKTHLRTILLTALTIIFVVYCITRTNNVRIVQHEFGNTTNVYTPSDTLLLITQDTSKTNEIALTDNSDSYTSTSSIKANFIEDLTPLAKNEAKKYNIPASIKIAQGALESSWGQSEIAQKAKNFYGIKKKQVLSDAEQELIKNRIRCRTSEFENNKKIYKVEEFCSYNSRWASFRHHSVFLRKRIDENYNGGYSKMKNLPLNDYENWARALQESGYSTDPEYAKKIIKIIETHKLYKLDK